MKNVVIQSELSCPNCGYRETLIMPLDACYWFHECSNCHALIKPKSGYCCVFCSYGSVPCPPLQRQGKPVINGEFCRDDLSTG